ncbi:lipase [Gymnopus androsaceus JB14]|uniref:Lipase n=1 Tax=Gymnopus androsaceus JB14 TaxID=1447944 RepID=A0A6A4GP72_9AGAR|nr:lipase [Gymnopus androsaceus JB14]
MGATTSTTTSTLSTLTTTQIDSFTPYTHYASAGYCNPSTTLSWTCGADCEANSDFIPVASGGDGSDVQYWFVGYDPTLSTVIVSHQGTNVDTILPIITDADFFLTPIDTSLFTTVNSGVYVHNGFATEQAKTATNVLAAVQTAMSSYSSTTVTVTGHSLGAAISLLDALYLSIQLPNAMVNFVGYGLPRVGNQAFANLIDSTLPDRVAHVNNEEDPVPILPGEVLGFVHPSGEKHIMDNGSWVVCPGQDNDSTECSAGDVPTILEGNIEDHDGPYNGVQMGSTCST